MSFKEAVDQATSRADLLGMRCVVFGPDSHGDYWTALPRGASLWRDREPVFIAEPKRVK